VPHQQPFDGFHRARPAPPRARNSRARLRRHWQSWSRALARTDGRRPLPHGLRAPDNRPW
jgi:hypothetical protein